MAAPLVLIQSPILTQSGYGAHSRDIVKALFELYPDWDFYFIPTRWGNTPHNAVDPNSDFGKKIHETILTGPLPRRPDLFIQISVPNEAQPVGIFNIMITAGIETTIVDPSWIEGCNRMDLIIVPSKHAKDIFEQTSFEKRDKQTNAVQEVLKLRKPVEVLFEGVLTDIFKPVKKEEIDPMLVSDIDSIPDDFCFLYCGHWLQGNLFHDRKDVGGLVKTFLETFKHEEKKPALILKTSGATYSYLDLEEIAYKVNQIKNLVGKNLPNVYILHGDLTDAGMNGLYNHPKIKAMVNFTHGEGYCRPLAEFCAATKKPLIVTGWSGQMDFLIPDGAVLLNGELRQVDPSAAWEGFIMKESSWFYVDYKAAGAIMKRVFLQYGQFDERGRKQHNHIVKNFTYDAMKEKMKPLLDSVINRIPKAMDIKLPKLQFIKPLNAQQTEQPVDVIAEPIEDATPQQERKKADPPNMSKATTTYLENVQTITIPDNSNTLFPK
jgi:hypothetical protein